MRIVSLLPSITEIVAALGMSDLLVGITHECDYPPAVQAIPVVTRSALDHSSASSAAIDAVVRSQLRDQLSIYHLDQQLLAELRPDLILTQALCDVCAVSYTTVCHAVRELPPATAAGVQVLSLEPNTLDDILATIVAVGAATAHEAEATALVAGLHARIERVRVRTAAARRVRVACLEWLDPPFGPGHWLPNLVELAGGQVGLGVAGAPSRRITWEAVVRFAPEVLVLTPCGFGLQRTVAEAESILPGLPGWADLPAVQSGRVFALDGNSYCSRPGPRIVESLELLAELIHPELCSGWGPAGAAQRVCMSDGGGR